MKALYIVAGRWVARSSCLADGGNEQPDIVPLSNKQAMIAQVIATCRAKGRKIGICGQAPSDYPEFAQFLVEQGIDSISLNPYTVLKTTLAILATEQATTC